MTIRCRGWFTFRDGYQDAVHKTQGHAKRCTIIIHIGFQRRAEPSENHDEVCCLHPALKVDELQAHDTSANDELQVTTTDARAFGLHPSSVASQFRARVLMIQSQISAWLVPRSPLSRLYHGRAGSNRNGCSQQRNCKGFGPGQSVAPSPAVSPTCIDVRRENQPTRPEKQFFHDGFCGRCAALDQVINR